MYCFASSSFFHSKLCENGYTYANVRRWSKKFDVFSKDKIFVPVNISNSHWCLAVIFIQKKKIEYYDSMNGAGRRTLDALLRYLGDEMKDKKKTDFDSDGWELNSRVSICNEALPLTSCRSYYLCIITERCTSAAEWV